MTSLKQIEANRRNARVSTGPRTTEGKAVSKLNAVRHGLLSQEVIVPGEDAGEFERLQQQLERELHPIGALEEQLVERIAASMWRLRRLHKVETDIFTIERLYAERDQAQTEAEKYKDGDTFLSLNMTVITNKKKHREAITRVESAEDVLRELVSTVGFAFREDARNRDVLTKLSRYETAIERSLYRALHELQRLQAARRGEGVSAPVAVDLNVDMGPSTTSDER